MISTITKQIPTIAGDQALTSCAGRRRHCVTATSRAIESNSCWKPDGWHIDYELKDTRLKGGGPQLRQRRGCVVKGGPRTLARKPCLPVRIDLFNGGYYWESHVALESLWIACGRKGIVADFLKGLIKLAAAGVKGLEGKPEGVKSHSGRASRTLARSSGGTRILHGLPNQGVD